MVDFFKKVFDVSTSKLYGIFVFWLLVLHANVVFAALFVDESLIYQEKRLLKNEYIRLEYFNFRYPNVVIRELVLFLLAAGFTWSMIWVLPKVLIARAYKRELDDKFARKGAKLEKEIELEKKKQKLTGARLETVKKAEEVAQKEEDLEQKEMEEWRQEYVNSIDDRIRHYIVNIYRSVYEYHSHVRRYYDEQNGEWIDPVVDSKAVAYAHSTGLVDFDASAGTIELTPKGKVFLSEYLKG